jgi:Rrf2 family protein
MVTFMTANSRMASAVHIMSFVAYAGDERTTSAAIAKSLQTNPVVVRKILKLLEREGLVALHQGRQGGVGLRRPASRITLGQIYKAVESETGVFAMRSQVHEGCAVACAMKTAQSLTLRTTPLSRLSAKRASRSWYAASAKFA